MGCCCSNDGNNYKHSRRNSDDNNKLAEYIIDAVRYIKDYKMSKKV